VTGLFIVVDQPFGKEMPVSFLNKDTA